MGERLNSVCALFAELNAQEIRYCHWKSNDHLEESLQGLTDFDLLVDRRHAEAFRALLAARAIKPMLSPPEKQYPAVEDYLGFDPTAGRAFHLHVHYQLVLGEQFVKNYRIPLEEAFLDQPRLYADLVKIPRPELELSILVLRALLKYRDRDVVKDALRVRSPGLPESLWREIAALLEQTSPAEVTRVLTAAWDAPLCAPIAALIGEFLDLYARQRRAGLRLYRLRQTLRALLRPYQRHSRAWATRRYFGALARSLWPKPWRSAEKKSLNTGGIVVGLVGADGAGKSTIIAELRRWLSWKLTVRRYYMGSQEQSALSRAAQLLARAARKLRLPRLHGFTRNLYYLAIAWDRYTRYLAGLRAAAQGAIVICDRYPLEAIAQVMQGIPMDGPRIAAEAAGPLTGLTARLAAWEQTLYRRIAPPDHLFVLHVSPDVSQQRKPDHEREMIENKSRALRAMDRGALNVTVIDADRPLEDVLLRIKTALWELL